MTIYTSSSPSVLSAEGLDHHLDPRLLQLPSHFSVPLYREAPLWSQLYALSSPPCLLSPLQLAFFPPFLQAAFAEVTSDLHVTSPVVHSRLESHSIALDARTSPPTPLHHLSLSSDLRPLLRESPPHCLLSYMGCSPNAYRQARPLPIFQI